MIMEKIKFTREEMAIMIDMLNAIVTDKEYLSTLLPNLPKSCPFWKNQEIKRDCCGSCSCSYCVSSNMLIFLDIVKDVLIKGESPINALTEESSAKAQTTKIRLYSENCYTSDSIDYLTLTDEQLRLLEYLASNDCLREDIDYEECGDSKFKTV